VAERIQPLSDVGPVRHVPAQPRTPARAPSFSELVHAHHAWWRGRQDGTPDHAAEAAYDSIHHAFEASHGQIVRAYWCADIPSAVALTEKKRLGGRVRSKFGFHRESDWATKNAPDIARELHRCDELGVRARIVLRGIRQRICLRLVMASAAHLLSLVDARAAHTDDTKIAAALEEERAALDKAESYYCTAANGQAQIVYFVGMVFTAAVISLVTAICLTAGWAGSEYAALIAGGVGAVVSVVQRINAGQFDLEYDVGRPYAFFLGGLRPLIGGAFALVIAFAFKSGVLHLPLSKTHTTSEEQFALIVLGFISGFSERFAKDTLAAAAATAVPSFNKTETTK